MSTLSNGIGSQHLTAGESSSSLVQFATSDSVEVIKSPNHSDIGTRRVLGKWLTLPKYVISGVTRDNLSAVLGAVTLTILNAATLLIRSDATGGGTVISDVNGNYGFEVGDLTPSVIIAHKSGAPDVDGISTQTAVGS